MKSDTVCSGHFKGKAHPIAYNSFILVPGMFDSDVKEKLTLYNVNSQQNNKICMLKYNTRIYIVNHS